MGLPRKLLAEGLGTALLLAIVIGSGVMADRLSSGNVAVALLANTLATVGGLYVLIEVFGAHQRCPLQPGGQRRDGMAWRAAAAVADALHRRAAHRRDAGRLVGACDVRHEPAPGLDPAAQRLGPVDRRRRGDLRAAAGHPARAGLAGGRDGGGLHRGSLLVHRVHILLRTRPPCSAACSATASRAFPQRAHRASCWPSSSAPRWPSACIVCCRRRPPPPHLLLPHVMSESLFPDASFPAAAHRPVRRAHPRAADGASAVPAPAAHPDALRLAARALLQPAADLRGRPAAGGHGRRGAHLQPGRPAPARRRAGDPPQGAGAARAGAVVRGHGLDLARAAWRHDRHHEGADRLDPAELRRRAAHAGQDAGRDAGVRRLAVLQRRQPAARAGPLDAHADHSPTSPRSPRPSPSSPRTAA